MQQQPPVVYDDWKNNSQSTIEYRRKAILYLQQKVYPNLPNNEIVQIEARIYNETNTKQEYGMRIQSTHSNPVDAHQTQMNQTNQMVQQQPQQMVMQPGQQYNKQTIIVPKAPGQAPIQQPQQNPTIVKHIQGTSMPNMQVKNIITLNPGQQMNPNQHQIQHQQIPQQQQQQIRPQIQQQQQQIRPQIPQQFAQNQTQMTGMNQQANQNPPQTYVINTSLHPQQGQQPQQIIINQSNPNLAQNQTLNMAAPNQAKIRPNLIATNPNLINQGMGQVVINTPQQQSTQQPSQQQPATGVGISSQFISQPQTTTQSAPQTSQLTSAEDELYNRKIEELRQHLPRLQKMYSNASVRANASETSKIKAFIDVINGTKKVSMDILIKCENSLNSQMQKLQQQQQQMQQNLQQQQQQQQQQQIQMIQTAPQGQPQQQIPAQNVPILARPQQTQHQQQQQPQTQPIQLQPQVIPNHQAKIQIAINTPNYPTQNQPTITQQQDIHSKPQIIQTQNLTPQQLQQQHQLQPQQNQQQTVHLQAKPHPQQLQNILQPQQIQQQQSPQIIQPKSEPQYIPQPSQPPSVQQASQPPSIKPPITSTPAQPPQTVQPPQLNKFQQLAQAIELCNNSNPIHKNNVRFLIDTIQTTLHGPPIKLIKLNFDDLKSVEQSPQSTFKRKRLINLRNHLTSMNSNENIPKKLLNELSILSSNQFRIEVKSKYQSLVLPIRDDENESDLRNESPLENDYVNLNCNIINRKLVVLVPPIRIFVPYNYPDANPIVDNIQLDDTEDDMLPGYNKLKILKRINKLFQINFLKLPDRFSVTQILDAWYASVENI